MVGFDIIRIRRWTPCGKTQTPTVAKRSKKMVAAAGGKLVEMYGTMAEGPGAMVIFDADPVAAGTAFATSKCSVCSPGTK